MDSWGCVLVSSMGTDSHDLLPFRHMAQAFFHQRAATRFSRRAQNTGGCLKIAVVISIVAAVARLIVAFEEEALVKRLGLTRRC